MKPFVRAVSVLAVFLLFAGWSQAQVITDFENAANGTQSWGKMWGGSYVSHARVADPTGRTAGVLAMNCDGGAGDAKAAIGIDPMKLGWDSADKPGAKFFTVDVWIPADFPDSAVIKVWCQVAEGSWQWTDIKYAIAGQSNRLFAGKWNTLHYPILYFMKQYANFQPWLKLKGGIEIGFSSDKSSGASFKGDVLIDNYALFGVEPITVADFSTDQGGFGKGWGDALTEVKQMADPDDATNGVLALSCDASQGDGKAAIAKDNLNLLWKSAEAEGAYFMTYKVYVPADFPTNALIKVWAQIAEGSWQWTDFKFSISGEGSRLKAGQWNTIHYPIKYAMAVWPNFQPWLKVKGGLEIYFGTGQTWTGTVLVDDFQLHTLEVGKKWVMADFEKASAGTQGFYNNNWGPALLAVSRTADPTGRSVGVMKTDWDFSKGSKGSFEHNNVNLKWTDTDTGATLVTIDIWLPADMPQGAQISIFGMDHKSWNWTEDKYFNTDSTLTPGKWHKLTYDVLKYVKDGKIDPKATLTIGCQIYYNVANTWSGSIYWDDFTLVGVEAPMGAVVSPKVTYTIETAQLPGGGSFDYAHLTWEDNTLGTETYNVYVSTRPITDLNAEDVNLIGDKVPHGTQYWNFRPYSSKIRSVDLYFAVTAVGPDGETALTDDCRVGPIQLATCMPARINYVADFASQFVLDGLDNEFEPYKHTGLKPERPGGAEAGNWTPESTDMNWNVTFVIDNDYLYISADVTDDDLNAIGDQPIYSGSQSWMGDALEFYLGIYNAVLLKRWHGHGTVDAGNGDWRISYTAWGTTERSGSAPYNFPGVEKTVYQKFTGDGYIIESRICLDSLAMGGNIDVVDGAMLPLRIDGTDLDPNPPHNDTGRTLWTGWGSMWNHEDWKRPSTWGFMEVVGGPTSVDDNPLNTPYEFSLANNYPNPFNPTTTLKYSLAKATQVTIKVYDLLGKEVRTLVDGKKQAGPHTVQWDGRNNLGQVVPTGIYFCQMVTSEYSRTIKMTMIK